MTRLLIAVGVAALTLGTAGFGSAQFSASERWSITDLGTLPGRPQTLPYDINDRGVIVGASMTRSGDPHAFLWRNGRLRDLGTLGGSWSNAYGINRRGQVVGEAETKAGFMHAFPWQNGKMRDLGPVAARASGWAIAINNHDQIVGSVKRRACSPVAEREDATVRHFGRHTACDQ